MAKVPVNKHQPIYQVPSNPTAVRTKKYALPTKKYTRLALKHLFQAQMKWALIPLALIIGNVALNLTKAYPNVWIYVVIVIGVLLYILFWVIQFMGITQLEQYKPMFEKYQYEIDPRQIFMKINQKEGGVMKWEQIQSAYKDPEGFVLVISRGQFLYLPFHIFNSEHDLKIMGRILKQKNLIKDEN
ncbi:hypothetical protein GCM10023091_11050 [Ravibacter arvi]|uniref:YcxB-like C-terminal domain-containing protein n=1 Tax=Ravibacter arvi TaxID=2051041 RepID=A0ABP8LUP9_9BACT